MAVIILILPYISSRQFKTRAPVGSLQVVSREERVKKPSIKNAKPVASDSNFEQKVIENRRKDSKRVGHRLPFVTPQKASWVFLCSMESGSRAQTITHDSQGAHDEDSFASVGSPTETFHEGEHTMLIEEADGRIGPAAKSSGDTKDITTFGESMQRHLTCYTTTFPWAARAVASNSSRSALVTPGSSAFFMSFENMGVMLLYNLEHGNREPRKLCPRYTPWHSSWRRQVQPGSLLCTETGW